MTAQTTPTLDAQGKLNHLLTIESLPTAIINDILSQAQQYLNPKNHSLSIHATLQDKFIVNAFFEDSTRTRCSFEMAAKRLGACVLNFNVQQSATSKGEQLFDTFNNLAAMKTDLFIIRHQQAGLPEKIAQQLQTQAKVINAGDGCHAHPSQALLDIFSIKQHKAAFEQLTIAIVGDILHSRVARSQIAALHAMNTAEIRVIAPKELIPESIADWDVQVYDQLEAGLTDVDVIIALRIQKERMQQHLQLDTNTFSQSFGINKQRLAMAKPDVIVMHPGPLNRGVELTSDVADGPHSIILQQVTYGVAVRMAIINTLLA